MFRVSWLVFLAELAVLSPGFDRQWYDSLEKPWFQPPSYAFGLAWGLLYPLIGYQYYLLLREGNERSLALFEIQLALNLAWSYVFFRLKNIPLSALLLVCMILLNVSFVSERWYKLYIAWLSFALVLTLSLKRPQ